MAAVADAVREPLADGPDLPDLRAVGALPAARHAGRRPLRRAAQLAPAAAAGVRHAGGRADPAVCPGRGQRRWSNRASAIPAATTSAASAWPGDAFDGWEHGFTWNHLWYLAYLWVYTLVLALLLPLLRIGAGQRLQRALTGLRGWWLLVLPALPLADRDADAAAAVRGHRRPGPRLVPPRDLLHRVPVRLLDRHRRGLWAELARLRRHSLALGAGAVRRLHRAGVRHCRTRLPTRCRR